jgi:hypothetical protein
MFYSISSSLSQIIPIKNYPVDKKDYLGDSKAAATLAGETYGPIYRPTKEI